MTVRILAALALSAACFTPATPAQQANSEGILWAKTWEAALEEARVRNAPILFTAHKDG